MLHPLIHLALLFWYFFAKSMRDKPFLAARLCAAGMGMAVADLVSMVAFSALSPGRLALGIVIDLGLAVLSGWRWSEAARKTTP